MHSAIHFIDRPTPRCVGNSTSPRAPAGTASRSAATKSQLNFGLTWSIGSACCALLGFYSKVSGEMGFDEYAARIAAAQGDAAELTRIAGELQGVPGPVAATLRFRAIGARLKLRQAASPIPPQRVRPMWLTNLGIDEIDGRPLYRYGVTEEQFLTLQELLKARSQQFGRSAGRELAGQFVLWAAEWFRRRYDGTGQRWDTLGSELGVHCSWSDWRHLADTGMRYWQLEPLKLNGMHHRLAAIARQGGFPVAAIERGGGWAPRFLEALVGHLAALPAPDLDTADPIAERLIGMVPDTWRSREMRVVSAELALEVVRLRRLAEADGVPAGALVSAWLDQHEPGWRDQLPLPIGSESARSLLDGLMRVVTLAGGHESVSCSRWLEIGADGRREGVELNLAGLLKDASGKALTSRLAEDWSRLRLYPSNAFSQHIAGELAAVDPEEDGHWRARPSILRTRFDLAMDVPITAELRGDGRRVVPPFILPGGEAVTSSLRVYARDGDGQAESALTLRLIGTCSGGFREEKIYADLPSGWSIAPHGEDAECDRWPDAARGERCLWQLFGAAVVTSDRGDRFLLRAGQKSGERDHLLLFGDRVTGCELGDAGCSLIKGAAIARLHEGRRERAAAADELWWRPAGTSAWRRGTEQAAPGRCEFAWRDRLTGHIRDRKDAVILPASFAVSIRRVGDWHEIAITGWSGQISASSGLVHSPDNWRLQAKGNTASRLILTLTGAEGGPFDLVVPLHHQAWIESWKDGPLGRNARLSLSAITRFVARTDGPCLLMADLLDRDRRAVAQGQASWLVDGELPLSAIRDDLAALLRSCGDLRASVRLNFNDGIDDYWFVAEFEHELNDERGGLVPDSAVVEEAVRVVRRPLHDPAKEYNDLGSYGLGDCLNHRPIALPALRGDNLVYLRAGDRVLSCPRVILGEQPAALPSTPLGRVMVLRNWHERSAALQGLCSDALCDPSGQTCRRFVRQIIDLALSLDGLPPAIFDALRLLCDQPLLAALLLFQARREELESLLRLAEGLPFAWCLVAQRHWYCAAGAQADYLFARIPDEPGLVAAAIGETRSAIAELEPSLAPLLEQLVRPEPLEDAANSFLNRSGDRIETSMVNPFRPRHEGLPTWRFSQAFWRALDAPVVAALAAHEKIELTAAELACTKDIARKHPRWFREAFVAAFKEM